MSVLRKFVPQNGEDTARIIDCINRLDQDDLNRFHAWDDLADLSSGTIFEAIDGDPDSVVLDTDGNFEAVASIYVTLVYGFGTDQDTMSDEYLASINGRLTDDGPEIDVISVDTSSFYE